MSGYPASTAGWLVVLFVACVFKWESICEHGEREGESLTAVQAEGATQAPVID